jgi:hypothetical protein
LPDLGATNGINSAVQLLNAISEFKAGIMASRNRHPYALWLKEIFGMLDSPGEMQVEHWRESLEKRMLPYMGYYDYDLTTGGKYGYVIEADFILWCINGLDSGEYHNESRGYSRIKDIKEQATNCFRIAFQEDSKRKSNPKISETKKWTNISVSIAVKWEPEGEKIEGEFMQSFQKLGVLTEATRGERLKDRDGNPIDTVYSARVQFPPVLLIKIERFMRGVGDTSERNKRPMAIPLKFEIQKEATIDSKSVKYWLIGGITCQWKTIVDAYKSRDPYPFEFSPKYVTYIRTRDGFFKCDNDKVQLISNEEASKALEAEGYMLAYRREN